MSNIVDDHLVPLRFMAEFAAGLVCEDMDAHGAQEGYFHIQRREGDQLVFCCVDILRRVEELINSLSQRDAA
ncbi:hypothetical protein [Bradyrhizobium sp. AZCC 2230]|uniref:hypothetical protein n=1 Tax=Bradyrhizobium sp. AZCC 2230 TaxID=3117021 RepID=UPI002FF06D53